jgi:peptidoglycan/LPS O-acetylase OafA/YrhL
MSQHTYRPALDGVRTLCIAFTLMNHIKGSPTYVSFNFGVDIFFALSGWLITWLLLGDGPSENTTLARFYIRRFFRIAPLYYVAIVIYALAGWLAKLPNHVDTLLLSFNPEYRFGIPNIIMGHAWTLGIEEKFYILWQFLLAYLGSKARTAWVMAAIGAMLILALSGFEPHIVRGYVGLGSGATLALAARRHPSVMAFLTKPYVAEVAAVAVLAFFCTSFLFSSAWASNVLISMSASFLVGSLWLRPEGGLSKALSVRPLPFLGTLTYAIYLFHQLGLNAAEIMVAKAGLAPVPLLIFVVAYALSICVAWPAHRMIEVP